MFRVEKLAGINPSAFSPDITRPNVAKPAKDASDLQELVELAAASVGHNGPPVSCGISIDPGTGMTETIATTDDLPIRFDWLQHELQQGPRSDPTRDDELVLSPDLARDRRWPEFGPLCEARAERAGLQRP